MIWLGGYLLVGYGYWRIVKFLVPVPGPFKWEGAAVTLCWPVSAILACVWLSLDVWQQSTSSTLSSALPSSSVPAGGTGPGADHTSSK